MKELLTNNDFCRAAKKLKCEVAAIKAVANVESAGKGFYADDFPVILFERHLFRKFTGGKYSKDYPELSGPQGNYGKGGQNQKNKFNQAFDLDPDAAMMACSWGKFQILGSNYKAAGYSTVGKFVDAMKESEGKHLDAFVSFVIANGLDKHLRSLNWAAFARGYNGPKYKENAYDTKMEKAYNKFAKENIDCKGATSTNVSDVSKPTTIDNGSDSSTSNTGNNTTTNNGDGEEDTSSSTDQIVVNKPDNVTINSGSGADKVAVVASPKPNFFSRIYTKIAAAVSGNVVFQYAMDSIGKLTGLALSPTVWWVIIVTVLVFTLAWLVWEMTKVIKERHRQAELDKVLVQENSTDNNNVQLIDPDDATLFAAKGWRIINRGEKLPTDVTDKMAGGKDKNDE